MAGAAPSIHASAVLVGAKAVLIRGAPGAGKSRLAAALIAAGACGRLPFARLVADDRVLLSAAHGRLLARAPEALGGLLEIRGLGIRRLAFEPVAVVGLIVDLGAADGARLPEQAARAATLCGVTLPRLPVENGKGPLTLVLAALSPPLWPGFAAVAATHQ